MADSKTEVQEEVEEILDKPMEREAIDLTGILNEPDDPLEAVSPLVIPDENNQKQEIHQETKPNPARAELPKQTPVSLEDPRQVALKIQQAKNANRAKSLGNRTSQGFKPKRF